MTIFGTRPVQPGDTVRPKDAERILAGEVLQELRHIRQTTTEQAARLASQVVNGILEAGTWPLDSDGLITRSYHVAVGSIVVTNNTGESVIVAAAGPGAVAPTQGAGVHIVPSGLVMTLPIGARAFTIYGSPGDPVGLQVFTGLQAYGIIQ